MIDEVALVEHLKENPMFRVGLDVFEVNEHTFSIQIGIINTNTILSYVITSSTNCIRMNLL